ncbi:S8 family serine peptidase [Paenibacillus albus]|uniref:S8 family serine peptidase n=1 Tax=Paenibacillus albus TaxID=2495582 RepID=UPI0013DEDBC7|nr:S8 family serine peptidase [Paenibacillus albus]
MKKTLKQAATLALTAALTLALTPLHGTASAASKLGTVENKHLAAKLHSQQQQQLQSLSSQSKSLKPAYISPKLNLSSNATVKVIVQLSAQPTSVGRFAASQGNRAFAAESTESSISSQQTTVLNAAKAKGINLTVNYQFSTVLNGMEVSVPANKIAELAKIPGVVSVYENRTYHAIPDLAADASDPLNFEIDPIAQIGADQAWAMGYTGRGLKVGVIDTGVDYLHPDLAGNYAGGYDSYFGDDDPYEEGPISKEDDPYGKGFAGTSHGTHVSGTIAGSASNPTSDIVQKGIAYESELHVYKVLGRDPATGEASGSSAQVIDGIEHAVKDGMDVINLSLGSDAEKDPNSPDAIAINNAVLAGVTAVIANGNAATDGPYYYSMGSPASSQLAISVGAVTSTENHYTATVTSSLGSLDSELTYPLNVMGWTTGQDSDFASLMGADPIEGVYVGLGKDSDYVGKDLTDKIAFISRGDIAFVDKIAIAKQAGAKAAVIFNGNSIGTEENAIPDLSDSIPGRDGAIDVFLSNSYDLLPTFDMEGQAGRALARALQASPDSPLTFAFGSDYPQTVVAGDHMADFSSRGPSSDGSFGIKPDVVAPGVNIMSTWPKYKQFNSDATYDQAYNRISGTSMATPHIAGLALLIKQAHPNWTPFDIRAALANTADEITDEDGVQYDVYSQGAGRANVVNAIKTESLLQSIDPLTILDKNLQPQQVTNFNDNASFGLMAPGEDAKEEFLQLKNTGSAAATYTASVVMHPNVTSDPSHPVPTPDINDIEARLLMLDDNDTITAAAHTDEQFVLQIKPSDTAAPGVYEGEVRLQSEGKPDLHIPFSVHVGDEQEATGFGVQNMQLSNTIISPDGDGVNDTTDLSFDLTATDANYMEVNVIGLDDQLIGNMAVLGILDEDENLVTLDPQNVTVTLDGSYTDDDQDKDGNYILKQLTAGTYKIEVIAANLVVVDGETVAKSVYSAYKTFGVSDPQVDQIVQQAKDHFVPNITNTSQVGRAVLTLPSTPGLVYQVTGSDNQDYVSASGTLVSLAGIPADSSVTVNLTVRIASSDNPSMAAYVTVPVELFAQTVRPLVVQNGTLSNSSGLVASVDVAQNRSGNTLEGSAFVVFQLMKGTSPVSMVSISKSEAGTSHLSAQFQVSGSSYWVKVFVVDTVDNSSSSVPVFLSNTLELRQQ